MNDVFSPVELAADCAADMPGRPAIARFPDGQAADDGRLVRAAREGERSAFATLYDRYARVVHGVLLARVSRDDVEDLVQDVFLAAWRRLDDLRDPAAFGGWLTMIARNRATDFHRRSPEFVELPESCRSGRLSRPKRTPGPRSRLSGSSRRLSGDTGAAARRGAHRSEIAMAPA